MSTQEHTNLWRWGSLLAALILLAFCLFLLGSHTASAAAQPPQTTAPQPPAPYRAPQVDLDPFILRAVAPSLTGLAQGDIDTELAAELTGAAGRIAPLGQLLPNPGFTLDLTQDALWGLVAPGDVVTATRTSDGAYAAAEADGVGFFWSYFWLDSGQPADIVGGDTIDVYVNGALDATLNPLVISGGVDVLTDEVTGNIAGLGTGTAVTVTLGDFGVLIADEPQVVTSVDSSDDFSAVFTGIADLGPHNSAQVQYQDANGHTIQDSVYPSEVFRVANWSAVEGYAAPGAVVTVTVYATFDTDVRWSKAVQASMQQGFYGAYGEIEYGDVVEVDLGGTVLSVTAAALQLWPDAASDQIDGWADVAEDTPVRGTIWDQFEGTYDQATDTVDGSGNFSLTFPSFDLRTAHWPYVAYADAEGDEVGYSAPPPHLRAYPILNYIWAVADGPHQPVTYTVDTGSEIWTQTAWCGKTNSCDEAYFDSLEPGYVVTAEFSGGRTNTMTVADVSMVPDTSGEGVSGEANIDGWLDVTICQWNGGPANGCGLGATTADPSYSINFPNFDVRDGMQLWIYHYDAVDGNRTFATRGTWETAYFEVYPWGVGGVPPQADEHVTAYLYDADGTTLLASTDNDGDENPWGFWFGDWQGYRIEPGHWVTLTADSDWTAGLQVPTLTIEADPASDRIWGDAPKSSVFVEHEWWDGESMWDGRWVPVDGYALDRAYFGSDLQNGNSVHVTYQQPNGNRVRQSMSLGELFRVEFWMEADGSTSMWGQAKTGEMVTITTPYTEVYRLADPGCDGCWDAYVEHLYPGDPVTVKAGPGEDPLYVTIADPLTANADSDTDEVWGQIGGWSEQMVQVHGEWEDGYREVTANASGEYLASYDDVPRGGRGYIRWETMDGYTQVVFHRTFQAPDLLMNVNYGHDWVEGNYEPGHTLWLTVTNDLGELQATIELETQPISWWGSQSGFSTNLEGVTWNPERPDIQEGGWVYGRLDNGQTAEVQIGAITGALDLDNDSIAGTVSAPWFTGMLNGNCGVWEDGGPGTDFQVDADGGGYACDFATTDPPWDLQPGHDVGVQYQEPDGDWVINVFRAPAPNVGIEKWTEGSGQAAPGGQVIYTLRYRNDGDGEATTLYLTDTLPADTTYVADTSGVTPTPGSGYLVWTLGPLAPGEQKQFQLVLNNLADAGETLHNVADIWALYDEDYGNNHAEAEVSVTDGQPDLYVSKNPNPGDPVPGQTMLWEIDYGNNGPVASGSVVLADTLPENTSIVDWSSQNGYNLWVDHSTADQLILEAPTVPGYWGDRIYLRLLVAGGVSVGTQLTNTVEIATAHDSDPNNNEHMRNDVWVGESRWDNAVDKNFGWGQLTPGGEIEYWLSVRNTGNMATHTVLTDVLPEGTSYSQSQSCDESTCVPFPPDSVVGQVVTWDLGTMEPGESLNWNLRVDIAGEVEPGTVLDNCAEVAIDGEDGWPSDNSDCVVATVNDSGPNLRIDKYYQWNGEGQLEYGIDFWNLGTTTLYDVEITDTLPDDTTFNANWWHNGFWAGIDFEQVGNQLIWTISQLEPTWSNGLGYQVDLNDDVVGVPELCFTNAAEAPIPDDVWPADNYSSVMACNGPNLEWVDFDVYRTSVWGCAQSVPITVTTALTETVYWDTCWNDGNFPDTFDPGDVVTVTAGSGFQPVVVQVPDPFTAFISSDTDRVWGQIDSLASEPVEIDVWGVATVHVDTDANGNYEALFDDLPHGAMGDVNYHTQVDYTQVTFHRRMDSLDLVLNLDYDGDNVWGRYAAGHTLWITVTESDGVTVKGAQQVTSWNIPWWGGEAGFETDGAAWSPGPGVDIQPFDWVFGRSDTGSTAEVHVGQITGNVDSSNNDIAGTVLADWWLGSGALGLQCQPTWGPNQMDEVLPNGVDLYSCSYDPATEWDVLPGDNITVQYWEPDGDAVQASFHEAAPNVNLEKWPEGSGQAMPGGVVVFSIRVQNYGEATADPVIVTDTLPTNAVYVADTAPAPPTFRPSQVVWDLGALEPGEQVQFLVYLQNTASDGDTVHNVADAWAPNDQDPNNNHAEADVSVTGALPDLYVNKSPDPGDPAPGQTMLWYIDYGNNGPVASGSVVLSDTIPAGTSVIDWWSEQGYDWTLLASNGQLRLEAPSIPGQWGDRLLLRIALDAGLLPGTQLTNTVEIATDPDANTDDNRHIRNDVWVSEMRWNVRVDKFFNGGTLVAGGEVNYGINVRNEGNMPATTTLTDILPPGTSLREAWLWDGRINYEAPPDETSGSTLVWHLGELQPAEFRNLTLILEIDGGVEAGTVLTNCAQVSLLEEDSQPADDESCAAVAVQGPGPNLHIEKYYQWNGEGQLQYGIEFKNLGTTTLTDVEITDTLPDDTTFNANWWHNGFWAGIDFEQVGNQLIWTISQLEPTWSNGLGYQVDLNDDVIGVQGLCFTNSAEAPIPDDVWPDDNYDQVTACTGPDVYIEKWVSGGVPAPGEIVTFTVEFGNKNRQPWNGNDQVGSHITETLPTGMTFITATAPWNPDEAWQPETIDGNTVVWGWGTMWADNRWRFDLVVEIDDTVEGGDVLVNTIKAKGDSPDDVEPDTDNNTFALPITVLGPVLEVSKTYDTNRVAGTTVTYTLSVANSGNAQATGATLIDTLPTGLTYLDSDGSYAGTDVSWAIASIAAGGTAEGWFSAELACQAGLSIVNDTYGVVSSNQGVDAWGTAVSFTTIVPSIQVSLDHNPEPALVGQTVTFVATASTNGTALTYEWDFGEGAVSGGPTATHDFDQAGSYEVSVTVTDACGFGETDTTTVQVAEGLSKVYLPMVLKNY